MKFQRVHPGWRVNRVNGWVLVVISLGMYSYGYGATETRFWPSTWQGWILLFAVAYVAVIEAIYIWAKWDELKALRIECKRLEAEARSVRMRK